MVHNVYIHPEKYIPSMDTTIVMPLWLWAVFFFASLLSSVFSIGAKTLGVVYAGLGLFLGVVTVATGFLVGETMVVNNVVTPVLYEYAPMLGLMGVAPLFFAVLMFVVHTIDVFKR